MTIYFQYIPYSYTQKCGFLVGKDRRDSQLLQPLIKSLTELMEPLSLPSSQVFFLFLFICVWFFFQVFRIDEFVICDLWSEFDELFSGASSGLGLETTRVLALRGVHVVMAVRNVNSGLDIKETLLKEIPAAKIDVFQLDLSSLASVRKFASDFNSSGFPLNILM